MDPPWERRWPGRLQYEIDALESAGAIVEVDAVAAAEGRLVLKLQWPRPGANGIIRLIAQYPDTFPFLRPYVFAPDLPAGRHVGPYGGVCLIGRGTHNWPSGMTLAQLLERQLEDAIKANADPAHAKAAGLEEQEGVPAEEWWNGYSQPDSYCLIDSGWTVDSAQDCGLLTVRYSIVGEVARPQIHAAVERVRASDGTTLCSWTQPLPADLRNGLVIAVPWVRQNTAPPFNPSIVDLQTLIAAHPYLVRRQVMSVSNVKGWRISFHAILYPTELGYGRYNDGWLFLMRFVPVKAGRQSIGPFTLRTLRGGVDDIGGRAPAVAALRRKRVLVIGLGAIGAPVAIELARNGCKELRLLDWDVVEPGNSIRWPLGATSWGKHKVTALRDYIGRDYPATAVVPIQIQLGRWIPPDMSVPPEQREDNILREAIEGVDLVMDMTAEQGINWLLDDLCREHRVPLITAHASPTLEGGYVARLIYGADFGCRMCLDEAWSRGRIPLPRGMHQGSNEESTALTHQAPGCAERTFLGANFDLAEISLQAVRLGVDTLVDAPQYPPGSCAHVVSWVDDQGQRVPPKWTACPIPVQPECQNAHQ